MPVPPLHSPLAAESLSAMLRKERAIHRRDYLHDGAADDDGNSSSASAEDAPPAIAVTESDRTMVVDWCYSIIDRCHLDRETVAMAADITDRFLSAPECPTRMYLSDRRQYQLLVISALYLATKVNESVEFGSAAFAETSAGIYTAQEIEAAEWALLSGLRWRVHAPTAVQIAHHALALVLQRVGDVVDERTALFLLDEVRFQSEYAVRSYYFATRRPSTAALAAVFNALEGIERKLRVECFHALLHVLQQDEYASPQELFEAKKRLKEVVDRDSPEEDEEDDEEEMWRRPSDAGSVTRRWDESEGGSFCDDSKSPRGILGIVE